MPVPKRIRRCLLLLIVCLVPACATRPPLERAGWDAHRAGVARVHDWQFTGRVGFRYRDESVSATLNWRQQGNAYVLRLIAPLGRGTYELRGSPGGVTLTTADNRVLRAGSADQLLQGELGWDLPVDGLVWWVRGLPRPAAKGPHMELDTLGRLAQLRQDGWTIIYHSYRTHEGMDLPARLDLENGSFTVRMAISRWQSL